MVAEVAVNKAGVEVAVVVVVAVGEAAAVIVAAAAVAEVVETPGSGLADGTRHPRGPRVRLQPRRVGNALLPPSVRDVLLVIMARCRFLLFPSLFVCSVICGVSSERQFGFCCFRVLFVSIMNSVVSNAGG